LSTSIESLLRLCQLKAAPNIQSHRSLNSRIDGCCNTGTSHHFPDRREICVLKMNFQDVCQLYARQIKNENKEHKIYSVLTFRFRLESPASLDACLGCKWQMSAGVDGGVDGGSKSSLEDAAALMTRRLGRQGSVASQRVTEGRGLARGA
jgi:hypothetical protein